MKKTFFFLFLAFTVIVANAQFINDEEPEYAEDNIPKLRDKLFFGGNLGLTFGQFSYVNISPIVGYKIKPNFSAGVGIIYEYFSDQRYQPYYSTTIFGGKLFAQSVLFDYLILYAENNTLSLECKHFDVVNNYPNDGRFMIQVPWVGAGFYQKAGRGGMYFMILFNLNTSANSPYPAYDYRIGINF